MALPLPRTEDASRRDASSLLPDALGPRGASPLDAALARLPAGSVWQASQLAHGQGAVHPSGFARLDAALPGGGWPAGALIELLSERPGVGELSLLLPLMRNAPATRWVVWIAPPLLPYAPALAHAGVPLARVLLVRTQGRQDLLWAARQACSSGSCACVLAWAPQLDATALRRLQLAAEDSATPIFLFRPRSAAGQSSPAPLRLALAAHEEGLQVQVLKRRGPPLATPLLLRLDATRDARPVPPESPAAAPLAAPPSASPATLALVR